MVETRKVTIIQADNMVGVDHEFYSVDCSDLPTYFHAIQWYGDKGKGEIEYDVDAKDRKLPNTPIVDFTPYTVYVDRWAAVKAEVEAERAKALAEAQEAENG